MTWNIAFSKQETVEDNDEEEDNDEDEDEDDDEDGVHFLSVQGGEA